ncbi:recombinase family protein [Nonomuraea sp. NPDC005501]|uniref:recombinase family protein n=1 Tax=Nonomuraea sp. NPDC005501 TaxID=3156884 RepID=UPI00339F0D84
MSPSSAGSAKVATDDRPALLNALSRIRDGDLLVTVQEVDRLGRNLPELLIVRNDLFLDGIGVVHKTLAEDPASGSAGKVTRRSDSDGSIGSGGSEAAQGVGSSGVV